jgi:thiosulfate reductase / polysulfide reductase chain A
MLLMAVKTVYSVCGMCPVRCPIEAEVQDGRCRFVQGNRRDPSLRGALCTRGAAGIAFLEDDERPQFPMLRTGARGEGRWQRVSWDQALATAAERLGALRAADGGRGLLWLDTGGPFSDLRRAFARGLGSPNFFTADSHRAVHRAHAALSLFGFTDERLAPDFRNARAVVLQGRNLFENVDVAQANDLLDGLQGGGRLTVIDVRATVSATKADRFFMIRPGTDYALNLAVIHTLLAQGLYDQAFAERWIAGLDELRLLVAPYTPAFAEAETGIPADRITALAAALAEAAPRAVWYPGPGLSRQAESFFVCRSAFIINALLGTIGARGGLALAARPEEVGEAPLRPLTDLVPPVDAPRADGVDVRYPEFAGGPGLLHAALHAVRTGDPYPVRGVIAYEQDPLAELPNPPAVQEALAGLDFLMCITSFWSETAWQADLVLPLSAYLERESVLGQRDGVTPSFLLRRRCVEPRFDTRADWEIVSGLAARLGLPQLAFARAEEIWASQLAGTGVRLKDFERNGIAPLTGQPRYDLLQDGFTFPTDSGKIELVNSRWRRQGLPSLAPYARKAAPPEGAFRLTTGGCGMHSGGRTVNNPLLHRRMPENVLWMNAAAGAGLGIADGDTVTVRRRDRSGRIRVKLTEHIHPEAVFVVDGFGRTLTVESRACGRGFSPNALIPVGLDEWDRSGGGQVQPDEPVRVVKE